VAVQLARYDIPVVDLDPAHEGLTIAHLSDVHVGLMTPRARIREAVELANTAEPDLVFMTGDYVCYQKKHVPRMGEQLRGLKAKSGVVAVLGNHDYWTDGDGVARELSGNGYDVLRNQNVEMRPRGVALTVVGIDDAVTKHHDVDRAFAGASKHGTTLTLSHCPELADRAAERGAHLTLSGHTHGGQIHFPSFSEKLYRRVTKRKYLTGWYRIGESMLYVNRGIGQSSLPIRSGEGARAEVAVFRLRKA
jgi:uncharacterized protein